MEECLSYFRDALHRPERVPGWGEWWAANEALVRESFSLVDYQRLKVRRLVGARDLLTRLGALDDPRPPVRLDIDFIEAVRGVRWFERCGQECRVVLPFPIVRATDWAAAGAACAGREWQSAQLAARNDLSLFLHNEWRARYQRWNDIVAAANAACVTSLEETVWWPFCRRLGLTEAFVQSVRLDILAAILAYEYGDCPGRPAFALHLFGLYRAGHFPCGWEGEWPAGRLLVL